jgi:hypothetical protein
MKRSTILFLVLLSLCLAVTLALSGTTGKIAGVVKDAQTGEPLPSVNVVVEGSNLGASTNINGYFVILNVPPGRYRVLASLVGFKPRTTGDVKVDIDQTTDLNISLTEEAIAGEEITVVATRPVVQRDVAASRANIEIQEINKLPIVAVSSAVNLQAGIQSGLIIRGSGADQTAFMVDGQMIRDARTLQPNTNVSLSAVQDIQVTTGGFSAEYGDLRSGVVNVVTREGGKQKYNFNFQTRYSGAQSKHFGPSVYDQNSYFIRPYIDNAVAWSGTDNGNWDYWTQQQYFSFPGGWNAVSKSMLNDGNPLNDITPQAAQQVFLWEHRRQPEIALPDYNFDAGFGGPVPFAEDLGNLRFFYSYIQGSEAYMIPIATDAYRYVNNQVKVTSDITGSMKLTATFLWGKQAGTNSVNSGAAGLFRSPESQGAVINRVSYIDARIFATDYWAPSNINNNAQGLKLAHSVNATTFYEAQVQRQEWRYDTNPGRYRDTAKIMVFGNTYAVDEAPYGFYDQPSTGINGIRMGVGFANSRDTTRSVTWEGKFDITSQLDKYNQVRAGIDFKYSDVNLNFGNVDIFLPVGRTFTHADAFPIYTGLYVQDKLEFELMVATIGLRMDYVAPNIMWYDITDPYSSAFSGNYSLGIDTLLTMSKVKPQTMLSPRLGVAFPITDYAKLFFNYGHMYQIPLPQQMFRVVRTTNDNQVFEIADPREPIPRTIQYELGYEHSLFDEYLLRVAAYYKDETHYPLYVNYAGKDGSVDYNRYTSNAYGDSRGFEVTFTRNRGSWVQGFINYTYAVRSSGYFGFDTYYQRASEQRAYELRNPQQNKPIPQPFGRLNVDFFTPSKFGPDGALQILLSDWRINLLGSWQSGTWATWTGGASIPGVANNVQWRDYWNFDMRITKNFRFGALNMELFADISNLFNYKYMNPGGYAFWDANDYGNYMRSLHMPAFPEDLKEKIGYVNIPGGDKVGSYRDFGVEYQPFEAIAEYANLSGIPAIKRTPRPYFYVAEQGKYYHLVGATQTGGQYVGGTWEEVESGALQKALDDKAYIDMPNMESYWFLNPRRIYWGVRLSVDI